MVNCTRFLVGRTPHFRSFFAIIIQASPFTFLRTYCHILHFIFIISQFLFPLPYIFIILFFTIFNFHYTFSLFSLFRNTHFYVVFLFFYFCFFHFKPHSRILIRFSIQFYIIFLMFLLYIKFVFHCFSLCALLDPYISH